MSQASFSILPPSSVPIPMPTGVRKRRVSVAVKLLSFVFAAVLLLIIVQGALTIIFAQQRNEADETRTLTALVNDFEDEIAQLENTAEALALIFAQRADLGLYLELQNRQQLLRLLTPIFRQLSEDHGISQMYLHTTAGVVFLRVHEPEIYGDNYSVTRPMIREAITTQAATVGIELDPNRLGVRAIVPMIHNGDFVGLMEIGIDYDQALLERLKARNNADYTLWIGYEAAAPSGLWPQGDEPASPSQNFFYYAGTRQTPLPLDGALYDQALTNGAQSLAFISTDDNEVAAVLAPINSYGDRAIGVLEIDRSRVEWIERVASAQVTTLLVALGLIVLSLTALGYLINRLVLRPLTAITRAASRQYGGDLGARVRQLSNDEFGVLGETFNTLSAKLGETLDDQSHTIDALETTRDELEKTVRRLKETSRYKDEFLAVMSHELRTPLNAMIGLLGITMMTAKLDDRSTMMITRARANSERLLSLINNILDISRMEAGRLEIIPTEVALRPLIEKIRENNAVLAEQKALAFTIDIDPALPDTLLIDEDALTKILTNLIANAIKFTKEGSVELCASSRGDQIEIAVTDTGVGIPAHLREVIFESFRQADSSSTRTYGGTGLGLAIVRNLCVAMGGTIRVQSEIGNGSTFTVLLPLRLLESPLMEAEYAV